MDDVGRSLGHLLGVCWIVERFEEGFHVEDLIEETTGFLAVTFERFVDVLPKGCDGSCCVRYCFHLTRCCIFQLELKIADFLNNMLIEYDLYPVVNFEDRGRISR